MEERILDVRREEVVKYSLTLELKSLKSLEALQVNVRFPDLQCGYGTLRS